MTLYHHTYSPFTLDAARTYEQAPSDMKPVGLWLSVEDGSRSWKEWCEAEDFNTDALAYRTEIVLADSANILRIDTPEGMDAFTIAYSKTYTPDKWGTLHCIDWPRVARDYQGIIIAPYQWTQRLSRACFWYYTWDCASGCVWGLSVVRALDSEFVGVSERV